MILISSIHITVLRKYESYNLTFSLLQYVVLPLIISITQQSQDMLDFV